MTPAPDPETDQTDLWFADIGVDDVDVAAVAVEREGGKGRKGPMELPDNKASCEKPDSRNAA